MKKRLLYVTLGLVLAVGVTACGSKGEEGSSVVTEQATTVSLQDEILNFVGADLPAIASERDAAVKLYNDYFSAVDKDSEKWMNTLSQEALPKYDAYLQKLKGLPFTNAEVGELKDLYTASAQYQRDAIQDVVDAIKNADNQLLDSAQKKVDQSKEKLQAYYDKLKKLCEANNISLEGMTEDPEANTSATEAASAKTTEAASETASEQTPDAAGENAGQQAPDAAGEGAETPAQE